MREASFVKANKKKWLLFENVLDKKEDISPDNLSDLYIEITDDLSYAKTFYPKSNTEFYLNGIASKAHQNIYQRQFCQVVHGRNLYRADFWKYGSIQVVTSAGLIAMVL